MMAFVPTCRPGRRIFIPLSAEECHRKGKGEERREIVRLSKEVLEAVLDFVKRILCLLRLFRFLRPWRKGLASLGAEAGSSGQESDIVRDLRGGAADSLSQVGQQIVQRQLNIAPTLTIRPGVNVRVVVTRDLVLEPYGG